ncbi:DUF268 domain-containing protein [Methylomonas fluvii]|uniref:DUF268 domain-containing protein n=1 Tax=Methylomonas fluvii TaxID=1854564 RepID=A0ABR9DJ54_9GAMM|nr:DUF268 domain-containing protein [Methylomonas fluvii]MBD9363139.1 DUF268 domain-containing protein [Methylomonas fluvii]CAD6876385.1 hypothetical protein [Methylomonas fluvii]
MLKSVLSKNRVIKNLYVILRLVTIDFKLSNLRNFIWFFRDFILLSKTRNRNFKSAPFHPCLDDKSYKTPIDPTYFFQDSWAAKKIFENHPKHHFDIGSAVKTISIISQFTPTTMIDIRPIDLKLDNFDFVQGSILSIPFADNSIISLSSLCVIEHIGLGRYGDPIDAFGSEKAAREIQRVLARGGDFYCSLPVDKECNIYFNAHRAFSRSYVFELFSDLILLEEKYHYGRVMYDNYDAQKGFGTGLFHFMKR